MTFLGAFLALLWDQLSPLHRPSQFDRLFGRYGDWVLTRFNAGSQAHGLLAWVVAALVPAALIALAGSLLAGIGYLLGLAWSAAVLYQCLGFRQLKQLADELQAALSAGDRQRARACLAEMGLADAGSLPDAELTRSALGQLLQLGLNRVFGVIFWFVPFGPFGALAYALTVPLAERWRGASDFHTAICRIMRWLDWLPGRLAVFSFAIVGNFEEAMLAWRGKDDDGLSTAAEAVRAAGFGALGLGDAAPDPDYVSGAVALLKRAVLLWLALLGLIWLAASSSLFQ